MSINTTVKVGFDGTAVKTGLKNIGGMFGKFNKEVGIGAARKVGELGTDLLGRAFSFFAEAPGMFIDYAGDLKDLSTLTDVSVNKLQVLQEAFRLAGVASMDTGKTIVLLSKSISEAREEALSGGGPMSEIFDKLKLGIGDLEKMKPAEQIEAIFYAMGQNVPKFGDQVKIMQALFGKGGLKMLQAFRDNFSGTMAQAEREIGSFGKMTKEEIDGLEALSDQAGRLPIVKMALFRNLLNGFFGAGAGSSAADELKKLFDSIMTGGDSMQKFGASMREQFDYISNNGFGQVYKDMQTGIGSFASDIGSKIGTAFSTAVDNYFKGTMLGSMMTKSMAQQQPAGSSQSGYKFGFNSEEGTKYLQKTVDILQRIYREGGGAVFQ
jgi:hypothetical protein